jgi:hypothetical protein
MSPSPAIWPAGTAVVPADSDFYIFVPRGRLNKSEIAASQPHQVHKVGETKDGLITYRLHVSAKDLFSVTVGDNFGPSTSTYEVDPGSVPANLKDESTTVYGASQTVNHWTCSFTESRTLKVKVSVLAAHYVLAYRVEYAKTMDALGEHIVVLPPSMSPHFGSPAAFSTDSELELGHVSCLGSTADESITRGPFFARVTPLFSSGPGTTSVVYAIGCDRVWQAKDGESLAGDVVCKDSTDQSEPSPLMESTQAESPETIKGIAQVEQATEATAEPPQPFSHSRANIFAALTGIMMGLGFALLRIRNTQRRQAMIAVAGGAAFLSALLAVMTGTTPWWLAYGFGALFFGLFAGMALGTARRSAGSETPDA